MAKKKEIEKRKRELENREISLYDLFPKEKIIETEKEYTINIVLPKGLDEKEDMQVDLKESILKIITKKEKGYEKKGKGYYERSQTREASYNSFPLPNLPSYVNMNNTKTNYDKKTGLLSIIFQKSIEEKEVGKGGAIALPAPKEKCLIKNK